MRNCPTKRCRRCSESRVFPRFYATSRAADRAPLPLRWRPMVRDFHSFGNPSGYLPVGRLSHSLQIPNYHPSPTNPQPCHQLDPCSTMRKFIGHPSTFHPFTTHSTNPTDQKTRNHQDNSGIFIHYRCEYNDT